MNSYQIVALLIAVALIIAWRRAGKPAGQIRNPPPHPCIAQLTWDKWSAISQDERTAFRKIALCLPSDSTSMEKWMALSVNDRDAFRLLINGGPMFMTPPDVSRCERLRSTGPTPCRYPNCDCNMGSCCSACNGDPTLVRLFHRGGHD